MDDRDFERSARRSTLLLLVFWFVVLGAMYASFHWWEQRQRVGLLPYTTQGGALVIARHPNGHFLVDGEVNGQPVKFLVDTGASSVAVTDSVAIAARLPKGAPITLQTAGGMRQGRIIYGIPVKAGSLISNATSVTTGLDNAGQGQEWALLGQSFLKNFDLQIFQDRMELRPRAQP